MSPRAVRRQLPWIPGGCLLSYVVCLVLCASSAARAADCNENGIEDAAEIAEGLLPDCNSDGTPDGCEVEASGVVFDVSYTHHPASGSGGMVRALAAEDIDGDGAGDTAVALYAAGKVEVRWGLGEGSLSEPSEIEVGPGPTALAALDLDGDGDRDLAVVLNAPESVEILLQTASRTFEPAGSHGVGPNPLSIAAGDFDGDGSIDLATADSSLTDGSVSILLAQGGGAYADALSHPVDRGTVRIAAGRIDGDGLADLLVASSGTRPLLSLLSRGNGTFLESASIPVSTFVQHLGLADLDSDGDPDVIAGSLTSGVVSVSLGGGDGSFASRQDLLVGTWYAFPEPADLDGDPLLDLLVGTDAGMHILTGRGDGTFEAGEIIFDITGEALKAADVDHDGTTDAVLAESSGAIFVFRNLPGRGFVAGEILPSEGLSSVAAIDFTGDGLTDIAAGGRERIEFRRGLGGGAFSEPSAVEVPLTARRIVFADLDGDSFPDIVANGNKTCATLLNRGDGDFRRGGDLHDSSIVEFASPAIHDIDGDGIVDFATVLEDEQEDQAIGIFPISADGTIGQPRRLPVSIGESGSVRAGDIDGDGLPDLAAGSLADSIHWWRGLGGGRFQAPDVVSAGVASLRTMELIDLDADRFSDLVVSTGEGLAVLRGSAGGLLSPLPLALALGTGLHAADMNGDGIVDILSGALTVLEGVGGGTFGELTRLPLRGVRYTPSDLDGDGRQDVVGIFGGISLVFNTTRPPLSPDCNLNGAPDSCDLAGGSSPDLDLDGVPDECQPDCDRDGVPDAFAISRGDVPDVDADGRPDACERDCNENGIPDDHDIAVGSSLDADRSLVPDECQPDCNGNSLPDLYEIDAGIAADLDGNSLPDDCDPDCNRNSVPDVLDLLRHDSRDANRNMTPDECDIESGASRDVNHNGIPDEAEVDCDADGLPDLTEILDGLEPDRNGNRRLDSCDIAGGTSRDIDGDGVPDEAQPDCNRNSIPDSHELVTGEASDCDGDGRLDACDLAAPAFDLNVPSRMDVADAPRQLRAADVDGDGLEDLVLLNRIVGEPVLEVLLDRGLAGHERLPPMELEAVPESLEVLDLDRDGFLDVLLLDDSSRALGGLGDGTFEDLPSPLLAGGASTRIADADGDGIMDALRPIGGQITVARGRGDGTFAGSRTFPAGSSPDAIEVGDLDGDGLPDVVAIDPHQLRVIALPGDGSGGLGAPIPSFVAHSPWRLDLADFTGDGRLDAAVATIVDTRLEESVVIFLLEGRGDGTFSQISSVPFRLAVRTLQAIDLDRDGAIDLVVASPDPGTVSVLAGLGALGFAPTRHYLAGLGTDSVVVLDRGGSTVIVAANGQADDISFLDVGDSGTIAAPRYLPAGGGGLIPADVTGDGWTDLVVSGADGLEVLLGGDEGSYPSIRVPTHDAPTSIAAGDVDGDGILDLAASQPRQSTMVTIVLSAGEGLFQPARSVRVATEQERVVLMEIDQDGRLDLLVVASGGTWVLHGRGDGSFVIVDILEYDYYRGFASGDFDRNGVLDLALSACCHHINLVLSQTNGSFLHRGTRNLPAAIDGLAAADLDGDRKLDLVATQRDTDSIGVLLGDGDGGFSDPALFPVAGREPVSIAALDLDGDGRLDLATGDFANGGTGGLSIFRGSGDGFFEPAIAVPLGRGVNHVTAADLDRDGAPDLALTIDEPSGVVLLHNRTGRRRDRDCDGNGVPDRCDIASGTHLDENTNGVLDLCETGGIGPIEFPCQVPGDANQDDRLDISDAITVLRFLFLGAPARLPCGDGSRGHPSNRMLLDWQPDGRINIADALATVWYLFREGPPHTLAVPGDEATGCVPMEDCPARNR